MISFFQSTLAGLSIHRVGNKLQDEFYVLSETAKDVSDLEAQYLLKYFLSPFEKFNEAFRFYHPSTDAQLNVVNKLVYDFLKKNGNTFYDFHSITKDIAKHLFEVSNHPKIKSGELYVAYFNDVQYKGELVNAIGIFKSENKQAFITVHPNQECFDISLEQEGVNLQKLDKGCLILNTDTASFRVLTIDNNSKDSGFWKDEFLQLQVVNDDYQKTATVLNLTKDFIANKLDQDFEISKSDKADLLNKSIKYFKERESFDIDEFTSEVFQNKEAASSFKKYKSIYDEEFDTVTPDSFYISDAAVKKKAASFKAIIKLDKNFHIYVHGNKQLIEKGFDEDRRMNYYKVYFKDEE